MQDTHKLQKLVCGDKRVCNLCHKLLHRRSVCRAGDIPCTWQGNSPSAHQEPTSPTTSMQRKAVSPTGPTRTMALGIDFKREHILLELKRTLEQSKNSTYHNIWDGLDKSPVGSRRFPQKEYNLERIDRDALKAYHYTALNSEITNQILHKKLFQTTENETVNLKMSSCWLKKEISGQEKRQHSASRKTITCPWTQYVCAHTASNA